MLENFANKKILILGFGKEGKDSLKFFQKIFPQKTIGVADKDEKVKNLKYKKVKWHLGKNYLNSIKKYDVILKSPGIPLSVVKPFLKKEQILTSQTEIFFENFPGKIIGVTGTKGKGTSATLIYEILKAAKMKVKLIGNIGKPVLNYLLKAKKSDIAVYELSSHQLENLKKSPSIAVFLNLFPAHLDFFKNFTTYCMAKANIFLHQRRNDILIYNSKDKNLKKIIKLAKSKKIAFDKNLKKNLKGINFSEIINPLNLSAVIEVAKIFKVPKKIIKNVVETFKGLPHRLEFVGTFKGISFYNDSLATVPEATIYALDTLGNRVQTLILGGSKTKVNFRNLAKRILKSKVENLIFFPDTGKEIWQEILNFKKRRKFKAFFVKSMKEAVELSFLFTLPGKICLLSPASPSFSLFKDYKERGNLFKKYVKKNT